MRALLLTAGAAALMAAWLPAAAGAQRAATTALPMNTIAERYVKLVLAVGEHDPAYVDAYYGPPEWKQAVAQQKLDLPALEHEADELLTALGGSTAPGTTGSGAANEAERQRRSYLQHQLSAVRARVQMLRGRKMTFDEESRALYDAVAPTHPESFFQSALDELDRTLPGRGQGTLVERLDRFREGFVIPKDKLSRVFDTAIAECRRRTLAHTSVPANESFTVEYVTNKSWSGYNWYQGNYRSLIQVNTDLPIYIDRAVDLACHEGYPGHHVYNVLLEQKMVRERGWQEMTVYPLFSPQSLIAEGSANYGIDVAFPGEERVQFERSVLFPAAGLDPARAAEYYHVQAILDRVSYAGNEAARRYLNGEIDRAAAAQWLTRFALMSPPRAEQRTRFMDDYRSYVINYNLGKDLVKAYVERQGGVASAPRKRWQIFTDLLGSQRLPSDLTAH